MYITTHRKECRKPLILVFCLLILSFFLASCRCGRSQKGEKPGDSIIVVTVDSNLVDRPPVFVNRHAYFYEDTVEMAGRIGLLKGSFVLDTAYALFLDEAIKVFPKKEIQDMEDPDVPQSNVRQIHLLYSGSGVEINCFAGKRAIVKGVLWGHYSGSHYTPVVMDVISMWLEDQNKTGQCEVVN